MLILHIGSPKTGTTALQSFLNLNEDALREAGVNYMRSARTHISHNPLPTAITKNNADELLDAIFAEYAESPGDTHILSSEILFRIIVARKLRRSFPEEMRKTTKVICYLRSQDSYVEVMYKQLLKNGRIAADRGAFLQSIRPRLNYTGILDAYAEIFGQANVIARPFAREQLVNRDIVDDFLHLADIEKTDQLQVTQEVSNKTLSVELSEMLSSVGRHTGYPTREVIRELIKLDMPKTIRSNDVFSRSQKAGILADLESENRQLVERYLPNDADFFGLGIDKQSAASTTEPSDSELEQNRMAATDALLTALNNMHVRSLEAASAATAPVAEVDDLSSQPPSWYREIYPGGSQTGFYHKLGDYAASFVDRGQNQLLITFDNLHNAGNKDFNREPWAQKFCADRGWSHLGIYAQASTWFRDRPLIEFLEGLKEQGFFRRFDAVSLAGTSMGGFAALAFAGLSPGSTVVAFSPQTTLDTNLVPWEHRFAKGRAADWSLKYSDAAEHVSSAGKAYIVYDPFMENDKKHVERLSGKNIVLLKGFGIGHKSALLLNRMGHLKAVMERGVSNELLPAEFYELMRSRKDIYMYRMNMEGYLTEKGKQTLIPQFRAAFIRRRKAAAKGKKK